MAQPDRGRSQGAEYGAIDRLAVQPRARRAFCLYGGGREAAQPEPDLRQQSRPPITLTRIALERAAELHGEELIGAHIKSASGGKTDLAGFAKTRQSMDIIRMRKHLGTHGEVSNQSWERPSRARRGGGAAGQAPGTELFPMETEAVPGGPSPQGRQPARLP